MKLVFALFAILLTVSGHAADATSWTLISNQPHPLKHLKIWTDQARSGKLRLRVENLQFDHRDGSPRNEVLWIAGNPTVAPKVSVVSGRYAKVEVDQHQPEKAEYSTEIQELEGRQLTAISPVGQFREYHIYGLTLTLDQRMVQTSRYIVQELELEIDLGAPPVGDRADSFQTMPDDYKQFLQSMLVNPNVDSRYYASTATEHDAKLAAWQSLLAERQWGDPVKATVWKPGNYQFALAELKSAAAAGADAQWAVYKDGLEIGAIETSASIIIPVTRGGGRIDEAQAFWFIPRAASHLPKRLKLQDSSTAADTSTSSVLSAKKVVRELTDYNPRLSNVPPMDRWVWKVLNDREPTLLPLPIPQLAVPSDIIVKIGYGFSNMPPLPPELQLYRHADLMGTATVNQTQGSVRFVLPSYSGGPTTLTARLQYPEEAVTPREINIQFAELEWNEAQPGRAGVDYSLNGSDLNALLDNADHASRLLIRSDADWIAANSSHLNKINSTQTLTVRYIDQHGGFEPPPALAAAPVLEIDLRRNIDHLILYPQGYAASAKELEPLLSTADAPATLADYEAIADWFDYGKRSAEANLRYIRHVFSLSPRLRYITLLGESSEYRGDPKSAPRQITINQMPVGAETSNRAMMGDHPYAAAVGNDHLRDFAVGRISGTPQDVENYAAKLKRYQATEPELLQQRVGLVFDDNEEFPEVVGDLMRRAVTGPLAAAPLAQTDFAYTVNNRVPGRKRSRGATNELLKQWEQGYGILAFFGHGGPNLWSHERMLHLVDLPLLPKLDRLPFIICASCDNAWLNFPVPPVNASIGEQLVTKPDSGGIALFGPVAGASSHEHKVMLRHLFQSFAAQGDLPVGLAIQYATNQYYSETRSASVPEQYILLGPPTVQLSLPKFNRLSVTTTTAFASEIQQTRITDSNVVGALWTLENLNLKTLTTGTVQSSLKPLEEVPVSPGLYQLQIELRDASAPLQAVLLNVLPQESEVVQFQTLTFDSATSPVSVELPRKIEISSLTKNKSLQVHVTNPNDFAVSATLVLKDQSGKPLGELKSISAPAKSVVAPYTLPIEITSALTSETYTFHAYINTSGTSDAHHRQASMQPINKPLPDLKVVPGTEKIYSESGRFPQQETVFLQVDVVNDSDSPTPSGIAVSGEVTTALGTRPTGTINSQANMNLPAFAARERRAITYRWEDANYADQSTVTLTVNPGNGVVESNYENNKHTFQPVQIQRLPDFSIGKMTASKADESGMVILAASFQSGEGQSDQPVIAEIAAVNAITGASAAQKFPITFLQNQAEITTTVKLSDGNNRLRVTINSDVEQEESNLDNNTTQSHLLLTYSANELKTSSDWLEAGETSNFEYFPTLGMRVKDPSTNITMKPADPSQLDANDARSQSNFRNHNWTLLPWKLARAASDIPSSITLNLGDFNSPFPGRYTILVATGGSLASKASPRFTASLNGGTVRVPTRHPTMKEGSSEYVVLGTLTHQTGPIKVTLQPALNAPLDLMSFRIISHSAQWVSPPLQGETNLGRIESFINAKGFTHSAIQWRSIVANNKTFDKWTDWGPRPTEFKVWEIYQMRYSALAPEGQQAYFNMLPQP